VRPASLAAAALGIALPAVARQRGMALRGTGDDLARRAFARHGVTIPPQGRADTGAVLDGPVRKAAA
jgi:hypothetical protein